MIEGLRAPIVTDADRKWSLDQCPPWASRETPEDFARDDVDPEAPRQRGERSQRFVWDWFVDDQVQSFERFFAHERKPSADWSRLWRRSWWPKSDPRKRDAKLVAKLNPGKPHPFARRGTSEFNEGLRLATPLERRLFEQVGVVQFAPDDPRAKVLAP